MINICIGAQVEALKYAREYSRKFARLLLFVCLLSFFCLLILFCLLQALLSVCAGHNTKQSLRFLFVCSPGVCLLAFCFFCLLIVAILLLLFVCFVLNTTLHTQPCACTPQSAAHYTLYHHTMGQGDAYQVSPT